MSMKFLVNSVAVAALSLASVVSVTDTASARDGYRDQRTFNGRTHGGNWGNQHAWRGGDYRRHRDHTGRNIAVGAFAAILGLALAAESQRVHDDYYDERD